MPVHQLRWLILKARGLQLGEWWVAKAQGVQHTPVLLNRSVSTPATPSSRSSSSDTYSSHVRLTWSYEHPQQQQVDNDIYTQQGYMGYEAESYGGQELYLIDFCECIILDRYELYCVGLELAFYAEVLITSFMLSIIKVH
ncbi:hypothetical protein BDQ17DRAFT_1333064 [Cyathus striatus]|nr:hypothetical protein BDQ17DRAFT_1333064 [Cyathus striatus]